MPRNQLPPFPQPITDLAFLFDGIVRVNTKRRAEVFSWAKKHLQECRDGSANALVLEIVLNRLVDHGYSLAVKCSACGEHGNIC